MEYTYTSLDVIASWFDYSNLCCQIISQTSQAGTVERCVLSPGRLLLAIVHAQIQQQADRTFLDKATPLLTLSHLQKLIHTIKRLIDSKSLKFSPIIASKLVLMVEMIMLHVQNQTIAVFWERNHCTLLRV